MKYLIFVCFRSLPTEVSQSAYLKFYKFVIVVDRKKRPFCWYAYLKVSKRSIFPKKLRSDWLPEKFLDLIQWHFRWFNDEILKTDVANLKLMALVFVLNTIRCMRTAKYIYWAYAYLHRHNKVLFYSILISIAARVVYLAYTDSKLPCYFTWLCFCAHM